MADVSDWPRKFATAPEAKKFPAPPEDPQEIYRIDWAAFKLNQERMMDLWNRAVATK